MLLLASSLPRAHVTKSVLCPVQCFYSTQVPKKAAGAFTSNKHIDGVKPPSHSTINKTLVYIGPFSETIRRYKMTATLFGVCGLAAVPALLSTGQAPALSVVLAGMSAVSPSLFIHYYTREYVAGMIAYENVKAIERQRKRPADIKDLWLGFETYSFFGRKQEHHVWLSSLSDVSNKRMIRWLDRKSRRIYALERHVVDTDPLLKGLSNKCGKVVG